MQIHDSIATTRNSSTRVGHLAEIAQNYCCFETFERLSNAERAKLRKFSAALRIVMNREECFIEIMYNVQFVLYVCVCSCIYGFFCGRRHMKVQYTRENIIEVRAETRRDLLVEKKRRDVTVLQLHTSKGYL